MPKTAVNMNETRKKKAKNGMRMIKTEREMKSNGRRINQPKMKSIKKFGNPKIFASLFPTNPLTKDVSQ
jgi:hypothetical protein